MSDWWTKANEIGDAIGKFNPVFQGIGAFTKMQVDHFDNNLARNRNKVTGELEINPIMRYLGKRPEYVEEAYGRDLRATPGAKKTYPSRRVSQKTTTSFCRSMKLQNAQI